MVLTRYNSASAEKVGDRIFKFRISDDSVDRYRTVIPKDAWQLDNYAKNGIVLYQHNSWSSDPDMVIGRGKAWIDDEGLMGEVELEDEEINPIAGKLAKKLAFGSIKATSVGFNPLEWSYGLKERGEDPDILYFRKVDLLEWSIVTIPANANATIQNSYADFVKMAFDDVKPSLDQQEEEVKLSLDQFKIRFDKMRISTL